MDFTVFTAGTDDKDRRLDKIIRKMIPENNISSLYSAIRKGLIKVNDKKSDGSYKICEGDHISIASFLISSSSALQNNESFDTDITSKKSKTVSKKEINVKIETVFSNDYIRIINKPYDISVHGTNGLSEIIESIYEKENHEASLAFKTGPLHRLDRKTTGLLAFSNNQEGARWFSKAIADKTVEKYYIGIVQGKVQLAQTWTETLEQAQNTNQSFYTMKVSSKFNEDDKAVTVCTPLAYGKFQNGDVTLCQFQILTGKKHQIRCQSAFHGFALLGDTAYGGIKLHKNQNLFLHAYMLVLPEDNPLKIPHILKAPVPPYFNKFLSDLLIKWNSKLIIEQ